MKVLIHGAAGRVRPALRPLLVRAVAAAFRSEKRRPAGAIHVILTDRPTIKRLNRQFLDETGDTDVIAFGYDVEPGAPRGDFADIYISVPTAADNARRFGEDAERELVRLAVHGTLHLLGHDDHAAGPRAKMWKRQEYLVRRLWSDRT